MEDASFFDVEYPMDSFALDFDSCFPASPQESYNSLSSRKRFHPESTQNSFILNNKVTANCSWNAANYDEVVSLNSTFPPKFISFGNSDTSSSVTSQHFNIDAKEMKPKMEIHYKGATAVMKNPSQARDHVIAERKRREKLSQMFCALSAILPGLKKNDKATILEDAIKHMKELQERVKILEEQVADRTVESAIIVKRSILFSDDDDSFDENADQSLSQIEARVCGKTFLFRIHCDKHSGRVPSAILCELEKHHLKIQSSAVLPFGNNTLEITIVAQMNKEHPLAVKDLIRRLSQAMKASLH